MLLDAAVGWPVDDVMAATAPGRIRVNKLSPRTNLGELAQMIQQQIAMINVLRGIPPEQMNGYKLDVSPLLGKMLDGAIADRRHLPLMDALIRWTGLTLEDNEDMVRDMIRQRANAVLRWTGLDEKLSSSVLDGLYRLLAEILVDPHHPLRNKIEEGLATFAID